MALYKSLRDEQSNLAKHDFLDGKGIGRATFCLEVFWTELYEAAFSLSPASPGTELLQPTTKAAELMFTSHYKPLHAFTIDEVQNSDWFKTLGIEPFKISRLSQ